MLDLAKKTLVVCAAISTFGGSAAVVTSGVSSMLDSKVQTVLQTTGVVTTSEDGSTVPVKKSASASSAVNQIWKAIAGLLQ